MKTAKAKAVLLRTWDVSLIRKREQFLGFVKAADRESAEAEAIKHFKLSDEQRKRLVVEARS